MAPLPLSAQLLYHKSDMKYGVLDKSTGTTGRCDYGHPVWDEQNTKEEERNMVDGG
jgi:hypothetical protein